MIVRYLHRPMSLIFGSLLAQFGLTGPNVYAHISPGFKQDGHFCVGFIANIPKENSGGCGFLTLPNYVGGYFDFKSGLKRHGEGDEDFCKNVTPEQAERVYGDSLIATGDNWRSYNLALTKTITDRLVFYAGAGLSFQSAYRRYQSRNNPIGQGKLYWIYDKSRSRIRPNALCGMMFRCFGSSQGYLQMGIEAQPFGAAVGIGFELL